VRRLERRTRHADHAGLRGLVFKASRGSKTSTSLPTSARTAALSRDRVGHGAARRSGRNHRYLLIGTTTRAQAGEEALLKRGVAERDFQQRNFSSIATDAKA